MSLTTTMPIFPGFKPGQSFTPPARPVRSPMWNYVETAKWNNSRQQAINGRVSVVKYWVNPLRTWEWTYGYLYDDPSGQAYGLGLNPFYPQPIPATDRGVLVGFYNGMQGSDLFAYQPPDSVQGGSMTVTSVSGVSDIFTLYGANTAQLGQIATISGLGTATFLNNHNLTILACSPTWIKVYFSHANYPLVADSGTVFCGQLLNVDINNNAEITHATGAYPTLPLTGTPPAYTLVNESVQLIDCASLVVTTEGASVPSYTLANASTIAPYQGIVIQFASAPTAPVTVSYDYFYPARFSEDTMETTNFLTMLDSCSKFSFEQDRL